MPWALGSYPFSPRLRHVPLHVKPRVPCPLEAPLRTSPAVPGTTSASTTGSSSKTPSSSKTTPPRSRPPKNLIQALPRSFPDANDAEDEDDDELLSLDSDLFNFNFFPDPGHGTEAPQDAAAITTEAQWFDSSLETLGDDEDEDDNHHRHLLHQLPSVFKVVASSPKSDGNVYHSNAHPPLHSEPASPASSYSDKFNLASPSSPPSPIAVPYPVPYPPLVKPYDADDEPCYYAPRARAAATATAAPYFLPYDDIEDSYLSMPDAMEDSASDDDTEPLPATPFSCSRSSFSLSNSDDVDPASVPFPREQRARGERPSMRIEPRIYASADDVFPFDPNPDMHSDTTPVYTPFFYQNC